MLLRQPNWQEKLKNSDVGKKNLQRVPQLSTNTNS